MSGNVALLGMRSTSTGIPTRKDPFSRGNDWGASETPEPNGEAAPAFFGTRLGKPRRRYLPAGDSLLSPSYSWFWSRSYRNTL